MARTRRDTLRACAASAVLCGPAFLIYGGFLVVPALLGFAYSFTDWTGWGTKHHFIGLANFQELFHDDVFYASLKLTFLETVLAIVFFSFGAMVLAVMLDRVRVMKGLIRALFFYPYILSVLVGGLIFQWMGNYRAGAINIVLRRLGLEAWTQEWMGPAWTPWFLFVFVAWSALGFFTTLYLANLQLIPEELYEAAQLDGAGAFHVFKNIQLPLLVPTLTTNSVMALILGVNLFGQIVVLWEQPRHDTFTVGYYIYHLGIRCNRQGYSAAVALVMFVFLVAVSLIQVAMLRRKETQL